MNLRNYMLVISIGIVLSSCSTSYKMKRGQVIPSDFTETIHIMTKKGIVLIPCEYEGITKNYYFDTGARLTDIQRGKLKGKRVSVRGASNRTIESGTEVLRSFKIGEVEFKNTFATNSDSRDLKKEIPDFGGTLGRPIIDRANWLIDRQKNVLTISNHDISDEGFLDIPLEANPIGAPHTYIHVESKSYKAIIDLGSTSMLNVPANSNLANELQKTYKFKDRPRDRITVGGNQTIIEKVCEIPSLKVGEVKFENVEVTINESSQIRIGINLFKGKLIYIDNLNKKYRVK